MKIKLIFIFFLSFNVVNYLNSNLNLSNWRKQIKNETNSRFYALIDKKLKRIKKDLQNTTISPFHENRNKKFKSGYDINSYKIIAQKKFLKTKFKKYSWAWWWKHNKLAFITLFPLYFKNKYNYYPPIYYDFFSEYGYYPDNEYFDICLDKYMNIYKENVKSIQNKSKYRSQCQNLEVALDFCVSILYKDILK